MKNIIKYSAACLAMFGLISLYSCEDAAYDVMKNQAFILQTNTNANASSKLTIAKEAVTTELNVRLSDKAVEKATFKLVPDENALKQYNEVNQSPYAFLPEGSYSLSSSEVSIEAGASISTPVVLTVNPFTDEMTNSGKKYAVAFKLETVGGNAAVLPAGGSMVYICDKVVIQPVPTFNYQLAVKNNPFKNGQEFTLNSWTIELNIKMSALGEGVGEMNNQAFFSNVGKEEIYIRFGDAPIPGNQLQIKLLGTQMNSKQLFKENKWYHLAFVYSAGTLNFYVNGILDNTKEGITDKPVIMKGFEMFNTSYFRSQVNVSELKIWDRPRSQAEVVNNMYVCDPSSEGLIGYWKFNEGEGNTYKDSSKNGNDMSTAGTPIWLQDVRIDGK